MGGGRADLRDLSVLMSMGSSRREARECFDGPGGGGLVHSATAVGMGGELPFLPLEIVGLAIVEFVVNRPNFAAYRAEWRSKG